jgi:hypothetical protein
VRLTHLIGTRTIEQIGTRDGVGGVGRSTSMDEGCEFGGCYEG